MALLGKRKLGIALGAGGGKGWAHIGILKVLQREKIHIDAIAGTSAGALVGAFFAAGQLHKFEEILLAMDSWKKSLRFFDLAYPKSGFIKGERISEMIDDVLGNIDFAQLRIPLSIVAVDIISGRQVIFNEKDLHIGIRASVSLPGVMTPVRYKGMLLVDGGLLNPLPVDVLHSYKVDKAIAVDLSGILLRKKGKKFIKGTDGYIYRKTSSEKKQNTRSISPSIEQIMKQEKEKTNKKNNSDKNESGMGIYDILMRTFTITQNQMLHLQIEKANPDLVLAPVLNFGLLEFYRAYEAIRAGEFTAYQNLKTIRKMIHPWYFL